MTRALPRSTLLYLILAASVLAGCRSDPMKTLLGHDPTDPFQVWAFTSADRQTWTRQARPVAHGFSSLGLSTTSQGEVVVTGLPHGQPPTWWEELFPLPRVFGMSFDGHRWSSRTWKPTGVTSDGLIDPQWLGQELWYFAVNGKTGDPAQQPGDHHICSTPPPRTRVSMPGLADPSPVRFQGKLHLFATLVPRQVIQLTGDPLREVRRFAGMDVPFAFVADHKLYLLTQDMRGATPEPLISSSTDGRSWTPFTRVLARGAVGSARPNSATPPIRSCTSPVMGPIKNGWILLCVEEP